MNNDIKKCIECGGETQAIQIIDRGQRNIHYTLAYTAGDSERSVFKGHDIEGDVHAEMCGNCGRITLRGAFKG